MRRRRRTRESFSCLLDRRVAGLAAARRDHEARAALSIDARIANGGVGAMGGNGREAQAREDGEEKLLHLRDS